MYDDLLFESWHFAAVSLCLMLPELLFAPKSHQAVGTFTFITGVVGSSIVLAQASSISALT